MFRVASSRDADEDGGAAFAQAADAWTHCREDLLHCLRHADGVEGEISAAAG
jgi:hypothetical protein